jgi:hypothetical protein
MNSTDDFRITFPQLLRLNSDRFWHGVVCGLCLFAAAMGLWATLGTRPPAPSTPPATPPASPVSAPLPIPAPTLAPERGNDLPPSMSSDETPESDAGRPVGPQANSIGP